jgi:S1-C subfamily serine protease
MPEDGIAKVTRANEIITLDGHAPINASSRVAKKNQSLIEPVVKLSYIGPNGPITSATGFSVQYDKIYNISYLITNDHFCSVMYKYPGFFTYTKSDEILSNNIDPYKIMHQTANVIKTDSSVDLCLMSVSGKIIPTSLENRDYSYETMEKTTSVGGPKGLFPIAVDSYITGLIEREFIGGDIRTGGKPFLLISQITYGGQSGSPIYNPKGKVIGVIFMQYRDNYGGIVIPLSDIHDFLESN